MIITVASGKGGTGKTTVAVSLALSLAGARLPRSSDNPARPLFVDCDVEEPNAALFLNPTVEERRAVGQMIPQVDLEACIHCGRCAEVCQFNAIAVVGENVLVFPELCHACGSCTLNCPTEAINEVLDVTGVIERGSSRSAFLLDGRSDLRAGTVDFAQGILNVGEAMAVPVIRQLKQWVIPALSGEQPVVLDAPPGNACPVVEAMSGADFVLLVTEPTPFGLHDLRHAVEVARDEMRLPVGVVINREGVGDRGVDAYCAAEDVPILMRIPIDRRIAEAYSEGVPLVAALPEYVEQFRVLYAHIERLVAQSKDVVLSMPKDSAR
ncbi:MAG: ATP-binding protein [Anaerolineae bacterium]